MKKLISFLFALAAFAAALSPIVSFAEDENSVSQGQVIAGLFPGCTEKAAAMTLATILADEGEQKADEYLYSPETPSCGVANPSVGRAVVGEVYVLQATDKGWVRVIELRRVDNEATFYWVTDTIVKKAPQGRSV